MKYWDKVKVTSWFYKGEYYLHWMFVSGDNLVYSLMNEYWNIIKFPGYGKEEIQPFREEDLELIK